MWLATLAILLRVVIPPGYMPVVSAGAGAFALEICSAASPKANHTDGRDTVPAGKHAADTAASGVCAFAGSISFALPEWPHHVGPTVVVVLAPLGADEQALLLTPREAAHGARAPPSQGDLSLTI